MAAILYTLLFMLGGVMVIPVDGTMLRVERINEDEAAITEHGAFRFVPLLRRRG